MVQRPQFLYCFSPFPDETWKFDRAIHELFQAMNGRVELQFSESTFERFRSGLSHHGIILREITRVPCPRWEPPPPVNDALSCEQPQATSQRSSPELGMADRTQPLD